MAKNIVTIEIETTESFERRIIRVNDKKVYEIAVSSQFLSANQNFNEILNKIFVEVNSELEFIGI
jgi:hypothetical protein